jgi:hypothetical protein
VRILLVFATLLAGVVFSRAADLIDRSFDTPKGKFRVTELSRGGNTSRIAVKGVRNLSAVGSSITIAVVCAEIARARHFAYFTVLSEDETGDGPMVIGFTNNRRPRIQKEFGPQYSPLMEGEPRPIMSVKEVDAISKPANRH